MVKVGEWAKYYCYSIISGAKDLVDLNQFGSEGNQEEWFMPCLARSCCCCDVWPSLVLEPKHRAMLFTSASTEPVLFACTGTEPMLFAWA